MRGWFSLIGLSAPLIQAADYTFSYDILYGPASFLSAYLDDAVLYNQVLDHGCWCSLLDLSTGQRRQKGGASGVDALDNICRDWLKCRTCSSEFAGGVCYGLDTTTFEYSIHINDQTNDVVCYEHDPNPPHDLYHECALASCIIDREYAMKIVNYLNNQPSWTPMNVNAGAQCSQGLAQYYERECVGEGANLLIVPKEQPVTPAPIVVNDGVTALGDDLELDFVLVMDGTEDLNLDQFSQGVNFLRELTTPFISSTNTTTNTFTVVQMGDSPIIHGDIHETEAVSVTSAFDDLANSQEKSRVRDTAQTLDFVNEVVDVYRRPNVPQIVVLVSVGPSDTGLFLQGQNGTFIDTADQLRAHGDVTVYQINLGNQGDNLASDPTDIFTIPTTDELGNIFGPIAEQIVEDNMAVQPGSPEYDALVGNTCYCDHGVAKTKVMCTTDGAHECRSCDDGYHFDSVDRSVCVLNVCDCVHGNPTTGLDCPMHSNSTCAVGGCDLGYHFEAATQSCEINICNCPNGEPHITRPSHLMCIEHNANHCFKCDVSYGLSAYTSAAGNTLTKCAENQCFCTYGIEKKFPNCGLMNNEECNLCFEGYHLENGVCVEDECICQGGDPVVHADCNSHQNNQCRACHTGYHLDNVNEICLENQCTCTNGDPVDTPGDCLVDQGNQCKSCDNGFHLDIATESCQVKVCTCSNGTPVPYTSCPNLGDHVCDVCDDNYYLDVNNRCQPNICNCPNGTPVSPCPTNGALVCSACDQYYHEVIDGSGNMSCSINTCNCPNGSPPVDGCTTQDVDECGTCITDYIIVNGLCEPITQEAVEEVCDVSIVDLYFVMDGSGSVGLSNYQAGVDFLNNLLGYMEVQADKTSVTVVQFATNVVFYTTADSSQTSVQNAMSTMRNSYMGQMTYTEKVLADVAMASLSHGRAGVPQVMFLLTDGAANGPNGLYHNGVYMPQVLHNQGFISFAIGIGGYSLAELQEIATDPDSEYVYTQSNFNNLDQVVLTLANAVCQEGTAWNRNYQQVAGGYSAALRSMDGPVGIENHTGMSIDDRFYQLTAGVQTTFVNDDHGQTEPLGNY